MEKILNIIKILSESKFVLSIIILFIGILLYKILINIIEKEEERNRFNVLKGKKRKTYWKLIKNIIRYIFLIIIALFILQINGVNVNSIIAGVGIFGVLFRNGNSRLVEGYNKGK